MENKLAWPARADGKPLCIAHRGASAHATENTARAFAVAAELGADMWEIDVYLTRDGVAVVSHDDKLERIFGAEGRIADLDLAEIRARAPDLPTLDETIELAKRFDQGLYVEVKVRGAGRVTERRLADAGFTRAVISSFIVEEIRDLSEGERRYPLAILVPLGVDPFGWAELSRADIIHLCWEDGGDGRPQDLVTPELLSRAKERGLGVVLWHEERRAVLDEIEKLPVNGICTNNPEMMARLDAAEALGISVVCHRGANRFAPENTLAAAQLAFQQGAHYVEIDVRESADGELVVIHDPTVDRTTNGTGRVDEMTAAELRSLDAGSWFSPHFSGERIPLLSEAIDVARSHGRKLYVENKSVDAERLVRFIEDAGFLGECFFWSGNAALQEGMRAVSNKARIKSSLCDYSGVEPMRAHLAPEIAEILFEDYRNFAPACIEAGMVPMLQYFGDDPAVFEEIVSLRPPMINLDRADLLLRACRAGNHVSGQT
ncbi:glycerophosphodiester phosphodiesterase family protein [Oricola thermophila]|uniref:GP-PDE domain-containing protein n=1 Tax=Oricola thermophila TaxID=2742145 RepID=A0A6N1VDQ9_9HYPH|nr:glycerophosphodiester phosphodiesterase family protein [Oricola thermophila]QKV17177.1 hypothetical protein HTY61_01185 [Oricola thermophila]